MKHSKIKIAMAQTKPVTGDLEGNVNQIITDLRRATTEGADVIVFPETAITGYCCGSLFENEDFVAYNKQFLHERVAPEVPDSMVAVVGFVDIKGRRANGKLDITNSAAIIKGGTVQGVYDKILLANDGHHEDMKYFTPGEEARVFDVQIKGENYRIGTPICEDAWSHDHDRDIIAEMVESGAELILNPNYSYFHYGKQDKRHQIFGGHSHDKRVPIISVNAVGVGDIVKNIMIYDGSSIAYDNEGKLVGAAQRFAPDLAYIELDDGTGTEIALKRLGKYEEIYDALKFEQQELFSLVGLQRAQVHVSGGIDSAVVAAVVADAMGAENSVFISNPTHDNKELMRGYAQHIADSLGVKLWWNPTEEPYRAVVDAHTTSFGEEPTLTGKACIQATLRTVQGIGAYHTFKTGIVAAGNHTEIVEGWASFHDIGSIGVHSLIGDLTKMEVFEFADYINRRAGKEIIPHELYDGTVKPAAELADASEDPLDYYVRSGIDAELIRHNKSINQIVADYRNRTLTEDFFPADAQGRSIYEHIDEADFTTQVLEAYENSRKSVFKAAQAAPIVIISPRSRGFSNRETIINHYPGWYHTGA